MEEVIEHAIEEAGTNGTTRAAKKTPIIPELFRMETDMRRLYFEVMLQGSELLTDRVDPMALFKKNQIDPEVWQKWVDENATATNSKGNPVATLDQMFRRSQYPIEEGFHTFPARGFKTAMRTGADLWHRRKHGADSDIYSKQVAGAIRIPCQYLRLYAAPKEPGEELKPHTGPTPYIAAAVNHQMKGDPKVPAVRALYEDWCIIVPVIFWPQAFNLNVLQNLIEYTGWAVGLGADRMEKGGNFGTFDFVNFHYEGMRWFARGVPPEKWKRPTAREFERLTKAKARA